MAGRDLKNTTTIAATPGIAFKLFKGLKTLKVLSTLTLGILGSKENKDTPTIKKSSQFHWSEK